jgi:hypothetical protein
LANEPNCTCKLTTSAPALFRERRIQTELLQLVYSNFTIVIILYMYISVDHISFPAGQKQQHLVGEESFYALIPSLANPQAINEHTETG